MSTATLERLRSELLTLSESERAEMAHELIKSFDAPALKGVEGVWNREIARRIAQIDSGQAKLLDREEFRKGYRPEFKADSALCTDTRRGGRGSC